jgi:hypothetical protein
MSKIFSYEISVVVQGPVSQSTKLCIESVRRFLPESFIIVSTNTGSKLDNLSLDYDKLIISPDVGAKYSCDLNGNKPNNVNRQIVSTFSGIKEVKTKYTLKLRSDFLLTGDGFLDYFDKYNEFNNSERFFEKRILACALFTKKPSKSKLLTMRGTGYPYHLSDFVQFGLTKDIYKLWDVDLVSDQDLNWFNSKSCPSQEESYRARYAVEQQLFVQFMRKNKIEYFAEYFCDRNQKNAEQTDLIMANNFVLLPFEKLCLNPLQNIFKLGTQNHYYALCYLVCYTYYDWLALYKKHCDPASKTKFIDWDFVKYLSFISLFCWRFIITTFGLSKSYESLKTHIKKFIFPSKISLNWFKEPFLIIFYLTKLLIKFLSKILSIIFQKIAF